MRRMHGVSQGCKVSSYEAYPAAPYIRRCANKQDRPEHATVLE
jgi:hypothetical protein